MYYIENDSLFGICQLGEWNEFDHKNIENPNLCFIDLSKPLPE